MAKIWIKTGIIKQYKTQVKICSIMRLCLKSEHTSASHCYGQLCMVAKFSQNYTNNAYTCFNLDLPIWQSVPLKSPAGED